MSQWDPGSEARSRSYVGGDEEDDADEREYAGEDCDDKDGGVGHLCEGSTVVGAVSTASVIPMVPPVPARVPALV